MEFTDACERLVQTVLAQNGVQFHKVEKRTKDPDRLEEKVDRDDKSYDSLEQITDLSGIRIITFFADDAPGISKLIHASFEVDENESIDKGAELSPEQFGYVSEHLVVSFTSERCRLADFEMYEGLKCEVQVRSILQHAWAEIEHDQGYKADIDVPVPIRRRFSRLSGLFELADGEFMRIRDDLAEYSTDVEEQVVSEVTQDVEINLTSLKIAIANSKTIQEIDELTAAKSAIKLDDLTERSDEIISSRAQALIALGITSVGQLEDSLKENGATLSDFAGKWVRREGAAKFVRFSGGVSILYLTYVLLLQKYDLEFTIKFFNRYYGWMLDLGIGEQLFQQGLD